MRSVPGVRINFGPHGTKNEYGGYIVTSAKEYPDNPEGTTSGCDC